MTADSTSIRLTGFTSEAGVRVFAFEVTDAEKRVTTASVRTDLSLLRKYGVPVQELPLLCHDFLAAQIAAAPVTLLVFGEQEMERLATARTAQRAAAEDRRAARKRPAHPPAESPNEALPATSVSSPSTARPRWSATGYHTPSH